MDTQTLIIERYESLRLFALDRQKTQIQWQNDYTRFVREGMSSWIVKGVIKMPDEPKVDLVIGDIDPKIDSQLYCKPQITQTIADILFKKIKETICYC